MELSTNFSFPLTHPHQPYSHIIPKQTTYSLQLSTLEMPRVKRKLQRSTKNIHGYNAILFHIFFRFSLLFFLSTFWFFFLLFFHIKKITYKNLANNRVTILNSTNNSNGISTYKFEPPLCPSPKIHASTTWNGRKRKPNLGYSSL